MGNGKKRVTPLFVV
ncbi:hypothetical protein H8S75_11500 [Hungatella sp. L12]|uniref:Uncharacterized protein n=1 Tax=Hungatella hominis TaxID=2763050 RepID=A0ABR7H633_9FIRM|nr:hypothetical protein [Hungatella hominis]